jgi:hypothetical protein
VVPGLADAERGDDVRVADVLTLLQRLRELLQLGHARREPVGEHLHRRRLLGLLVHRPEHRPGEPAADHPLQLEVAQHLPFEGRERVVRLDRADGHVHFGRRRCAEGRSRRRLLGEHAGIEPHVRVADAEDAAGPQWFRLLDSPAVDQRAVGTEQVGDGDAVGIDDELAVGAGDVQVAEADVAATGLADGDGAGLRQFERVPVVRPVDDDQSPGEGVHGRRRVGGGRRRDQHGQFRPADLAGQVGGVTFDFDLTLDTEDAQRVGRAVPEAEAGGVHSQGELIPVAVDDEGGGGHGEPPSGRD